MITFVLACIGAGCLALALGAGVALFQYRGDGKNNGPDNSRLLADVRRK